MDRWREGRALQSYPRVKRPGQPWAIGRAARAAGRQLRGCARLGKQRKVNIVVLPGTRLVVSGPVRCRDHLVIVENSSPNGPQWSAPGGKVEPGETPIAAVIREIYEECGLVVQSPRRPVHTTYMTFATEESVETWIALGYEFP